MKPASKHVVDLFEGQIAHREERDESFRVYYNFYTIDFLFYTIEKDCIFNPDIGRIYMPTPFTLDDGIKSHREAKFKQI